MHTLPLRAMADSDAALKRRVAVMETALDEVRAELAAVRGEIAMMRDSNDSALAAMAAAVTAQADATRAAASAAAKPDVPEDVSSSVSPMRAAYAMALALVDGRLRARCAGPALWSSAS